MSPTAWEQGLLGTLLCTMNALMDGICVGNLLMLQWLPHVFHHG